MSICGPRAQHSAPCRLLYTSPPCTAPRTRLCTARRRRLCRRHPRPLSGSCIRHTARRCTLQSAQPWRAHVPRTSRRRRHRRCRYRRRRMSMAQHGIRRGPGRRRGRYACDVHVRHRGVTVISHMEVTMPSCFWVVDPDKSAQAKGAACIHPHNSPRPAGGPAAHDKSLRGSRKYIASKAARHSPGT